MTDKMMIYSPCSCDPNLVRVTGPGGCLVVAAGREVEPGAELADMYTQHWTEQATADRRDYLQVISNMKVCQRGFVGYNIKRSSYYMVIFAHKCQVSKSVKILSCV